MRRTLIGLGAAGAVALVAVLGASAQDRGRGGPGGPSGDGRGDRPPISSADREAFAEARIAGMKAGLRLTPDQEKLWPPVEEAMRGLVRQRAEARTARRERWASLRDVEEIDIPDQLRFMADRQAASAEALRRLADASGPLYKTLDEAQRRRLRVLARFMAPRPGMGGGGPMMRRGEWGGGGRGFAEERRFGGDPRGR